MLWIHALFSGLGFRPALREASDAIAVRRVNSDAAFRTTFSRVWRFTLFAFASVIFTWLKYACVSPILTQGRR